MILIHNYSKVFKCSIQPLSSSVL